MTSLKYIIFNELPWIKNSVIKTSITNVPVIKISIPEISAMQAFSTAWAALIILSCFLSSVARADGADLLLSVLQQHNSMQAQFEQQVLDVDGREIQASRGQLKIQKPKQFLWRTSEPFEQEIVSDGEKMWILDVDLDQLTIQPLDRQWESTPALLLIGDEQEVRANFSIHLLSKIGSRLTFNVHPLAEQSAYKKLELVLENERIVAMSFTDHLEQVSSIQFSHIVVGQPIDQSEFKIVPAPGVDVIDYYSDAGLIPSGLSSERFVDGVAP